MDELNETSFSRTGISSAMGKCSEPVKVWLPPEIELELKQLAASDGATASELLRDMVVLRLRGKTWGELQAQSRREVLIGQGPLAALPVEDRMTNGPRLQAVRGRA